MITSDRTAGILSLLPSKLSLSRSLQDLLSEYQGAQPYPHLILDDLFPAEELSALLNELPPPSSEEWFHQKDKHIAKTNFRSAADLKENGFRFASVLHSAAFLYFLTEITGISGLLPDPYLSGGGYQVMEEGGKFDVHVDRNKDYYCGLQRRLAMLIYLNKEWKSDFGGQLELWNQDGTRCEKVVEPIFNRTVIFQIGESNFHAVRPIVRGSGARRKSFAAYFHTVGSSQVSHNSIYAPSIYRVKETPIHQVTRLTVPPFVWLALRKLKNRKRDRGVQS